MLKMVVVVLLSAAAADVWLDVPNASSRCADIPFAGNVSVVYFGTVYCQTLRSLSTAVPVCVYCAPLPLHLPVTLCTGL